MSLDKSHSLNVPFELCKVTWVASDSCLIVFILREYGVNFFTASIEWVLN